MAESASPEGELVLERSVGNIVAVFLTNCVLALVGTSFLGLVLFSSSSGLRGMNSLMGATLPFLGAYFIYVAVRMSMGRRTRVAIEGGSLVVDQAIKAPLFLGGKASYELSSLDMELKEGRKTTTYGAFLITMLLGPLIRVMITNFDKKLPRYFTIRDRGGKKVLRLSEEHLKAFGYDKAAEWLAAKGFKLARLKT